MNETTQQEKTTQLSSRNEQLNSAAGTKHSSVGTKQLNSTGENNSTHVLGNFKGAKKLTPAYQSSKARVLPVCKLAFALPIPPSSVQTLELVSSKPIATSYQCHFLRTSRRTSTITCMFLLGDFDLFKQIDKETSSGRSFAALFTQLLTKAALPVAVAQPTAAM
ncbi:hypothetical protein TNCV_1322001 [Trichonephila clavipes]|nr:hypothetical protein TNCV_1322001 [Trichonephila clavipes]